MKKVNILTRLYILGQFVVEERNFFLLYAFYDFFPFLPFSPLFRAILSRLSNRRKSFRYRSWRETGDGLEKSKSPLSASLY